MNNLYRIHPQAGMNFHGLVIDNFAGGGGASTGIELGLGRPVDIAVNHDPEAVAMHDINHPHTRHYCESVWEVDPRVIADGRPVDLAWFSPDCKHFSKAKGATPVKKEIRGLAWVALRYAATVRPKVIMLENVEEFVTWGPITQEGRPCPKNKGRTFMSFVNALRRHGYQVDYRELRACDYGAPTIRKRLFLIARCDGQPLQEPLHTVTTKDRYGLVMIKGEPYQIADIGMRMLEPHELFAAQGFPADYIHDRTAGGKPLKKTAQVRMCGNSVCPPVAAALVRTNLVEQQQSEVAA